jgi:hypothetical protein
VTHPQYHPSTSVLSPSRDDCRYIHTEGNPPLARLQTMAEERRCVPLVPDPTDPCAVAPAKSRASTAEFWPKQAPRCPELHLRGAQWLRRRAVPPGHAAAGGCWLVLPACIALQVAGPGAHALRVCCVDISCRPSPCWRRTLRSASACWWWIPLPHHSAMSATTQECSSMRTAAACSSRCCHQLWSELEAA